MKTQDIKNMGLAYQQVLESSKAALAKKLAKASQSSEKGKAAVTLPKAPFDIPKKDTNEALKGNQHKLDMDKDGDIDAKDFAHMRKKKKNMDEEEVLINPKMKDKKKAGSENGEMAAEAKVDEVSKATLGSYAKKASADAASRASDAMDKAKSGDTKGFGKQFVKSRSRLKGAQKAIDKLAKEETTVWPVYARIKENRAAHTKSATEPEAMDSKASKGEKDFKAMHKVDMQPAELEDKGHDDASKAGRVTKKAPARNGDNPAGDKIQTPVDTTKG